MFKTNQIQSLLDVPIRHIMDLPSEFAAVSIDCSAKTPWGSAGIAYGLFENDLQDMEMHDFDTEQVLFLAVHGKRLKLKVPLTYNGVDLLGREFDSVRINHHNHIELESEDDGGFKVSFDIVSYSLKQSPSSAKE